LIYSGVCKNAEEAMELFLLKRNAQVDSPSQVRYIQYFDKVFSSKKVLNEMKLTLKKLIIYNISNYYLNGIYSLLIFLIDSELSVYIYYLHSKNTQVDKCLLLKKKIDFSRYSMLFLIFQKGIQCYS
jgi:flagellar biosynthesis protein FlhB